MVAAVILAQVAAAQVAISATAPPAVSACAAVEVRVSVSAPGHVAPQVVAPSFGPFQVLRRTTRPAVTFDATGEPAVTVEHVYVIASDVPGTYTIAPFRAELGGTSARSRPLVIHVRSAPDPSAPAVIAGARIDTSRDVNFRAVAVPDTVYVGEQVQYEVAVFLSEEARGRLRRNPTFYPPDMPGMLAYDIPAGRGEPPRRQVGGRCFDALVYQRAVFPLQAGRIVIPPAQLVYSLPIGRGLFSRDATHEMHTDSVVVVALAPPVDGRPANDLGAVGTLDVAARMDTTEGRVGDPLLFTVRVSGEANVKLLPRPQLSVPWGSLVPDGERVEIDSAGARITGAKEFDWLVTPREGGRLVVPPVEYPHFDPTERRYVVSRTEPLALEIEPAELAQADTATTHQRLALRAEYRGPLGRPLHAHPALWLLAAVAPLPAVAGLVRRRRPPTEGQLAPADALAALPRQPMLDVAAVRRAFVRALADRLRIPAATFTRTGGVERALRRSGVTRPLAQEAELFLRELDAAAYGTEAGAAGDARVAALTAGRIYAEVDAEALARWELGPVTSMGLTVLLLGALATSALATETRDATEFAAGVRAYESGRVAVAAATFERIALRQPRAPDAWANYGTASWAASDTAGAVVGWQRALRLEPLADDLRGRLDALRLEPVGAAGYVPPVGVAPLALSALVVWLIAWVMAATRPRRGSATSALSVGGVAAAMLLVGLAIITDERLAADDAVVLRHAAGLSAAPAVGADERARIETGEVGEAGAHEGGWTHVRFDGGRAGWIPSSELRSIARAPAPAD